VVILESAGLRIVRRPEKNKSVGVLGVGVVTERFVSAVAFAFVVSVAGGTATAVAAPCPGNPDAIGISRVLRISAQDFPRLGHMQYRDSLPLNEREVVLTFDDGPLPPYTNRVLEILAHECVKATFFLVGRHTAANPETARLVHAAGHTIGNHSQNHSLHFDTLGKVQAEKEITNGMRAIRAALGDDAALAPFFRIPGLNRTRAIEKYAQDHDISVWSSDTLADDWTHISAKEVLQRGLRRLEAKGRGIFLLHDIQPRTVLMLPTLLTELKRRGFKIVHVVPDGAPAPKPQVDPSFAVAMNANLGWPRIVAKVSAQVMEAALTERVVERAEPPRFRHPMRPKRQSKSVQTAQIFASHRFGALR
jgi:peptidoglycan/xylan/chitin deacetylase (PgdA/CDA1 family)